jgi:hypothetical protein
LLALLGKANGAGARAAPLNGEATSPKEVSLAVLQWLSNPQRSLSPMKQVEPEAGYFDAEIGQLKKNILRLQAQKERSESIAASLASERESLAYSALVTEDPNSIEALKRLQQKIRTHAR